MLPTVKFAPNVIVSIGLSGGHASSFHGPIEHIWSAVTTRQVGVTALVAYKTTKNAIKNKRSRQRRSLALAF